LLGWLQKFGKLVRVELKGEMGYGMGEWGKQYEACWVLWSLYVFGYIFIVVVLGACVRDCRGLGLCIVGTIG
jgi:hypothetical protein